MKVKELSGMQSLKHLPQEEREKVGLQRRKDLELLYDKIRNLKSRLERKEEMLKDYEAGMEQLRYRKARRLLLATGPSETESWDAK
ncbi:hypothetical protein QYF61_021310 [Mycteria americana]|uniref:Uncharacterized protein n=1 Tax=Mycteria americana TaxID=33587 RepID=A0AAN7MMH3_MYCAM|nr:hypothetical protein QYF61_021310 [Mycteria americana]